MHILILNWRDVKHPLAGGAEVCVYEHAKYWVEKGEEVTWFSSRFPGAKKQETIEGIKVIRFGNQYTVHLHAFWTYTRKKISEVDVVIDCFHFIPFFTPLYFRNTRTVALIHEVAGELWYKNLFYPLAFIGYHLEPYFIRIYNKVQFITVSESTKRDLEKIHIPSNNITVIPNGVTLPREHSKDEKEEDPTIMFLGRISEDKGISDALEVFLKVKKSIPRLKFWVVGREEKKGLFKQYLSKKNIDHGLITYFDYVNEEEKFALLKKAWLLIHPSQKEGWGLTVIEAATQGTPTVGYDVEGLRDSIIQDKTGLLTDKSPQAMSDAVSELLNDKIRYNAIAKEAHAWSKAFDWQKSSKESYRIIKQNE